MNFDLRYTDFNSHIAIIILIESGHYNWYLQEYVKTLEKEEFYWFMHGLTS